MVHQLAPASKKPADFERRKGLIDAMSAVRVAASSLFARTSMIVRACSSTSACSGEPDLEVHAIWTDLRSPEQVTHEGQIVVPDGFGVYSVRESFEDFARGMTDGVRIQIQLPGGTGIETTLPVGACLSNCADACTLANIVGEEFVAVVGSDGLVSVDRASCRNEAGDSEGWISRRVHNGARAR
jgi:hypothetical protein